MILRLFLVLCLLGVNMADVTYTIEAIDKSTATMLKISSAITGLNQATQLLNQVYRTSQQVINATIGEQVKYANSVRTITQVTGQSSQAVSRMIQVADDYKISTEQLTLAMKKMATEGKSLTTDSLAKMSDEYLKLSAGVERQTYLTEKFGRSGIAFSEIMLAGGAAIRAQSAAVSQNLILSDKAVKQARDYELALDDLNDSIQGVKIGIGQKLIPALTDLLKAQNNVTEAADESRGSWMRYVPVLGTVWNAYISIDSAIKDVKQNIADNKPLDSATLSMIGYGESLARAAELQGLLNEEIVDITPKIYDYASVISNASVSLSDLSVAAYQASLTVDGVLSAESAQKVLDYALALGNITAEEYRALAAALLLQSTLDALDGRNVTTTVRTVIQNVIASGGSANDVRQAEIGMGVIQPRAAGGPLTGVNEVGEQGTEGIINGIVIPHGKWERMKRAGLVPGRHFATGGAVSTPEGGYFDPYQPPKNPWGSSGWVKDTEKQSWVDRGPTKTPWGGKGNEVNSTWGLPSSTQASAAVETAVKSSATVAASAATISESGKQTAAATEKNTQQNNQANAQIIAELKNIQNMLAQNFQAMPKQWAAAQARTV